MHVGDLGAVQNLIGSALSEMVEDGPFTGSKDARCEQVWRLIKKHYDLRGTPSRLGKLTKDMFWSEDGWPKLSAKAADSQQLLFVMEDVCREIHDDSEHDWHRIYAFREVSAMYMIFKSSDMFISHSDAECALGHCQRFFALRVAL